MDNEQDITTGKLRSCSSCARCVVLCTVSLCSRSWVGVGRRVGGSGVFSFTWRVRNLVDVVLHLAVGAHPLARLARLGAHERALGLLSVQLLVHLRRRIERPDAATQRTALLVACRAIESCVADLAAAMPVGTDHRVAQNPPTKSHTHMTRTHSIGYYMQFYTSCGACNAAATICPRPVCRW